jgi:hypothetical protein
MLTWILLLVCAGAPAGYAQGNSEAEVGPKIIALENLWNQAIELKDLKALNTILDNAFIYVEPDGRLLNKTEVFAYVRTSPKLQLTLEPMAVHLHGDAAVITGIRDVKGIEHGRPFVRRERFVDTWRQQNGSWVSIASLAMDLGN